MLKIFEDLHIEEGLDFFIVPEWNKWKLEGGRFWKSIRQNFLIKRTAPKLDSNVFSAELIQTDNVLSETF